MGAGGAGSDGGNNPFEQQAKERARQQAKAEAAAAKKE